MSDSDELYDVLCYGTISMDNITRLDRLPDPRRDAVANFEYNEVGGEALQVAIPLATWGLRVLVVGNAIGADWKGQFITGELARYPAIDTRYLQQRDDVITPFSRILVTPDGERSRIAYWFDHAPQVRLSETMMRMARLLSIDAYGHDERDHAVKVARTLNKPIISADAICPESPLASLSDGIIISSAWLLVNYPGVYEYDHALELQAAGAGDIVITDGPRPVLVVRADGSAFGVEPYEFLDVVDTSGAGNLFRAGLIYSWLQADWPLQQKVKFACAAAGLYCRRKRGDDPPPSLAEIAALMNAQPRQ
jgi:sugar/nucleoside kinase (ribokinase family)